MKYLISTDEAIIAYIRSKPSGAAILHACVGNDTLQHREGIVTSCDVKNRQVTLQQPTGAKDTFSFNHISIPDLP